MRRADRVAELDGLRGVLAWIVVGTHVLVLSGWFDPLLPRFPILGEIPETAVDAFILLSGFAITHVLVGQPTLRSYFTRRVCRIVPVYFFALLLGIFLTGTMIENFRQLPAGSVGPFYIHVCEVGQQRLSMDAALHFLFLHGLVPAKVLPHAPYTLLGVAWSLSLEFQFYLIAPALFVICWRSRFAFFSLGMVVIIATLFAGKIIAIFSSAFLPAKAAFFFVGALGYFALQEPRARRALNLSLGANVLLGLFYWIGTRRIYESFLAPLIWTSLLLAVRFDYLQFLRAFLRTNFMQLIGRISYSTYLLHVPILILLQAGIWRWLHPDSTLRLLFATSAAAAPLILLGSYLSWRLIERPFQQLGRASSKSV